MSVQTVDEIMRQCLTCLETKPLSQYKRLGGRGIGNYTSECISCYNRNATLSCDSCSVNVVEECRLRATLRLPVQCEDWDDTEWARIGIPQYVQEQNEPETIVALLRLQKIDVTK